LPARMFISFAVISFLLCFIHCMFLRDIFFAFSTSYLCLLICLLLLYLISFAVAFLISHKSICFLVYSANSKLHNLRNG
jgi:hypothetical protein